MNSAEFPFRVKILFLNFLYALSLEHFIQSNTAYIYW